MMELTDMQWDDLLNAWREQNDAGEGEAFDFGDDGEGTIQDILNHESVVVLARRGNQAIIRTDTRFAAHRAMMVCDANGPWLCDVQETWGAIEARNNHANKNA